MEGEGGEAQHEVNGPERVWGCDMGRIRRSRGWRRIMGHNILRGWERSIRIFTGHGGDW